MDNVKAETSGAGPDKSELLQEKDFHVVCDVLFGMIDAVYSATGGVNNQVYGIELKDGKVAGIGAVPIENEAMHLRIPSIIQHMLLTFPIVAHVVEAWAAPNRNGPPSQNPERRDVVIVHLHSNQKIMVAHCDADEKSKKVTRGVLFKVDRLGGRIGRELPVAH